MHQGLHNDKITHEWNVQDNHRYNESGGLRSPGHGLLGLKPEGQNIRSEGPLVGVRPDPVKATSGARSANTTAKLGPQAAGSSMHSQNGVDRPGHASNAGKGNNAASRPLLEGKTKGQVKGGEGEGAAAGLLGAEGRTRAQIRGGGLVEEASSSVKARRQRRRHVVPAGGPT